MFVPRHPVVQNQFCSYGENASFGSTGVGGVVAYAGSVLYLDEDATNEEAMVFAYSTQAAFAALGDEEKVPFGFAMQKVKVGYHSVHPTGFSMPGDLGSSDVIAQPHYDSSGNIDGHKSAPLGVAHNGIWDTVHYTCNHASGVITNYMKPGERLYPATAAGSTPNGKVTNCATVADNADDDGECLVATAVARVVKGASKAKCEANLANTTLYPIRIKLLI